MRIAALGCSHTCGYHVADIPDDVSLNHETWPYSGKWHDNNWAEFYINSKDADGVIFANSSNGWWEYSEWLSFLFKKYDDIKQFPTYNDGLICLEKYMIKRNNNNIVCKIELDYEYANL